MERLDRALKLAKELKGVAQRLETELLQFKVVTRNEYDQLWAACDDVPDFAAVVDSIQIKEEIATDANDSNES